MDVSRPDPETEFMLISHVSPGEYELLHAVLTEHARSLRRRIQRLQAEQASWLWKTQKMQRLAVAELARARVQLSLTERMANDLLRGLITPEESEEKTLL